MKFKITKKDFDASIKQPWGGETCLVAQAMMRQGIVVHGPSHPVDFSPSNTEAGNARSIYGRYFDKPGDETKLALQKLRASLPITIEL